MRYLRTPAIFERPPVLLIHGLLGYSFSWRFNIPALARRRTVYAVDLPGVGFSERCPGQDCSALGLARVLSEFLRQQDVPRVDVVGTSHGGGIAMMLAALGQQRGAAFSVRRLVLSAPVNPWSNNGQLTAAFLATNFGAALFRSMHGRLVALRGRVLERMYGDPSRIRPGTVEAYAAPLNIDGTTGHLLRIMRCWRHDLREIERMLPGIAHVPSLLLWGDRDKAVTLRSAHSLRMQFHHAALFVLPQAGHMPYEEMPDRFNDALISFLDN